MDYLRYPILATIVYYDILDFPLTLIEVYKYLINPGRLSRLSSGVGEIDLNDLRKEMDRLVSSSLIAEKNGFYFLSGRDELYDLRIERNKITDQKWKKFLRLGKWLTLAPYVRGFLACGSTALGNTTKDSDFDVFVISAPDRLYTCRFFLWAISSLLRARRRPSDKTAPDKFCFNHYITEDDMFLKYQSLYTAQLYSNLKPVFIDASLFGKFYSSNIWINNYLYNFKPQKDFVRRSIRRIYLLLLIAKVGETILNSFIGIILESVLKKYQQDRIRKNPLTNEFGGRVVFTDQELEFHPHSFEKVMLAKYKSGITRLGIISNIEEKDSGLNS